VQLETKLAKGAGALVAVCVEGGRQRRDCWPVHNGPIISERDSWRVAEREGKQQTECETEWESESETGRLSTMPH